MRSTELPSWDSKRQTILSEFTTNEKLSIVSSFLDGFESSSAASSAGQKLEDGNGGVLTKPHRMEQLDAFDDRAIRRMANLTQEEYAKKIRELRANLMAAWESDLRVESIRIAIQCAKLLSDISVIQFYPSKFVLVTDILDTFGNLVYSRLFSKASLDSVSSLTASGSTAFTPNDIPELAKETCRNWFYKIASIRELLPRFYMETAILKSLMFLNSQEHRASVNRLAVMVRGIGDPLVAAYARCYLARVSLMLCPNFKQPLLHCLQDFVLTQNCLPSVIPESISGASIKVEQRLRQYMQIFRPAIDWLMHCLAQEAGEKLFTQILNSYGEIMERGNVKFQGMQAELFLTSLLSNFSARLAAPQSPMILTIVEGMGMPESRSNALRALGRCVVNSEPDCDKLELLQRAWKLIMQFESSKYYINSAETWFHFAACYLPVMELNVLLTDLVDRMSRDKAYERHYAELQAVLSILLDRVHPFPRIFQLDRFVALVDLLQKDHVRTSSAMRILESFCKHQIQVSDDIVLAGMLMALSKKVHDSLNAVSLEDERRNVSRLVCSFIDKFKFNADYEQQLSFFMEARGNFSNLDQVLAHLIHSVNDLAMRTRNRLTVVKTTRKLAGFLRACMAYTYITIPSIADPFLKLPLYIESAQVALLNNCLPQGDAMLADCIKLLPTVPCRTKLPNYQSKSKSNDPIMLEFISNLLSFVLVVPDSPERGILYFTRGIFEAIQRYPWTEQMDCKAQAHLSLLSWCSTASLPEYPYHIEGINSNDTLYAQNEEFLTVLADLSRLVLNELLAFMQKLNADPHSGERVGRLAIDLLSCLTNYGDVTDEEMVKLAISLWKLVQKHSCKSLEKPFRAFKAELELKQQNQQDGTMFSGFRERLKNS